MQIKTKDAEEATFLWTHQDIFLQRVQTIQSSYKKIVFFVFRTQRKSQQILNLLNDYQNGKTLVQPRKYSWKRSQVKQIIKQNIYR